MRESPYIVPQLAATRNGIPDPVLMVDCWLKQLRELLATAPSTAHEAYHLLVLWAKMQRIRPELAAQLGAAESRREADAALARHGPQLAAEALTVPAAPAWLEAADELQRMYDEPETAEARCRLAERALTGLDDAELVLYAARRFGVDDPELETRLIHCRGWLTEHVELFLAASVHVQAVGMTFRPDLADFDYALAVTALKYLDVLAAAEMAETQLALADVKQFDPAVARGLAARFRQQRDLLLAAQKAFLSQVIVLRNCMRRIPLARAAESTVSPSLCWWEWTSPAGTALARLTIPPDPTADQHVVLEFVEADGRRATQLAGQTATLHGVAITIDSQAKATFPLVQLLQTEEPLILRVGLNQIEWRLTAAHVDP